MEKLDFSLYLTPRPSALDFYAPYVFCISRSLKIVATMTGDVRDPTHRPPCIRCIWFNSQVALVLISLKAPIKELNESIKAFRDTLSTFDQSKFFPTAADMSQYLTSNIIAVLADEFL